MKICYCDLDGVFTNYPRCWLDYIEMKTGHHFDTLEDAKSHLFYQVYVDLKQKYRTSDYKYNLTPTEGSATFTQRLRQDGWFVVVATTRPLRHKMTVKWLAKNRIEYDRLMFVKDKFRIHRAYPKFVFGIDDDPLVCEALAMLNHKMFLLKNGRVLDGHHPNVVPIDKLQEAY